MKSTRHVFHCAALAAAIALPAFPALAADENLAAKKRPSIVREAKRLPRTEATLESSSAELPPGQFVYQMLLAEIALQRGDLDLASKAYASLALRTRDPKVLERTIEVAGYARRFDLALEATRLWLEVEPESNRAQQLLVGMMILSNQLDELAPILVRMLENDKPTLEGNLLGLNRMFARNPDRLAVFRLVDQVCRPFFGLPEAHYAVAIAASSAGMRERAMAEIRRALELRPDWEAPAFLGGQLLARESPADAIDFMQDFVKRHPDAHDVRLQLARTLIAEKRYTEAKYHFDQLLIAAPDRPEIIYPVAILALQQGDKALAEEQLRRYVALDTVDKNIAYYYLGQIAEEDKRSDEALSFYTQVSSGDQRLPALIRSAHIMARQGKLGAARTLLGEAKTETKDERTQLSIAEASLLREAGQTSAAFALLDQALVSQPDNADLLYETALLAERLGRIELMESRLRKLIALRPDSAQAYNALGYSYAERNIRLPEARELIEKALQLSPQDSFILDSLGWVLFRQGDTDGALKHLEQAYSQRTDPEIAAHLGEVLWTLGRKDDARRLLLEAQKQHPDNDVLTDAVRKFAP